MHIIIALFAQRSFTQSSDELKSKYKRLMTEYHPDRHATSSEEEKAGKASVATDVTRAYSVIEDPLTRALHLLELHGAAIEESDNVRLICVPTYLLLPSLPSYIYNTTLL